MDWWTYVVMGVPLAGAVFAGGVMIVRSVISLVRAVRSGEVTVGDIAEAAADEAVDLIQQGLELAQLVAYVVRKGWISEDDVVAIQKESEDVAEVIKRITDLARATANAKGEKFEKPEVEKSP